MKTRHVFSTDDIRAARAAVDALRQVGLSDDNLSLVARQDIENSQIPEDQQDTGGRYRDSNLAPHSRGAWKLEHLNRGEVHE